MKSFEPGFFEKQPIPQNLLRSIRLLGEYKGKELTRDMIRVVLNRLKKEKRVYCEGRGAAATWYKQAKK
ncbi:MAG: hypothetical protein LC794_04880 [Acidobacteria bacterium]|nr:hypothetical protein [Acidobacteriota bacterium]